MDHGKKHVDPSEVTPEGLRPSRDLIVKPVAAVIERDDNSMTPMQIASAAMQLVLAGIGGAHDQGYCMSCFMLTLLEAANVSLAKQGVPIAFGFAEVPSSMEPDGTFVRVGGDGQTRH